MQITQCIRYAFHYRSSISVSVVDDIIISVVVKDLRLKDEDKDEDLKIGPRGYSRTRTFLEDNNTDNNLA